MVWRGRARCNGGMTSFVVPVQTLVRRSALRLAMVRQRGGGSADLSTLQQIPARGRFPFQRVGLDPVPKSDSATTWSTCTSSLVSSPRRNSMVRPE